MTDTAITLCAGDSLTEGAYGESYVARLAGALESGESGLRGRVVNAGRGADTLQALLGRIREPLRRHRPATVVLAIGINDIWLPWLASHSLIWHVWLLRRRFRDHQVPTTDLDQFAALYRSLIGLVRDEGVSTVVACTTSCCGERLSTPANRQLARLNGVIKQAAGDCQVPVADVWQAFVDELAPIELASGYVAGEWIFAAMDRRRLQTSSADEISSRRRLHLTFDGIHLNSRGADLWARTILDTLASAG
jgi:lysophospholipase L1-like esterase